MTMKGDTFAPSVLHKGGEDSATESSGNAKALSMNALKDSLHTSGNTDALSLGNLKSSLTESTVAEDKKSFSIGQNGVDFSAMRAALDGGKPSSGNDKKLLSKQRIKEIKSKQEEKVFNGVASSLIDALEGVQTKPSLLADGNGSTGFNRKEFGKGLSVIDQYAIDIHQRQVKSDFAFQTSKSKKTQGGKDVKLSRKAKARKEKAKSKGISYNEKCANRGAVKRSKQKAKSKRFQAY
mmetsp:Transcript_44396/g.71116  ORF Transcript_44396/g.71116 Transcript_44396/m.71116 type:complete len:237 (+) Transcript_44396:305-1015(+)